MHHKSPKTAKQVNKVSNAEWRPGHLLLCQPMPAPLGITGPMGVSWGVPQETPEHEYIVLALCVFALPQVLFPHFCVDRSHTWERPRAIPGTSQGCPGTTLGCPDKFRRDIFRRGETS